MSNRVFVGRLPYEATSRDIERFFKGYGRVRDILMKRGYAFVELSESRDAEDAVHELNGERMMGMRVVVEHAKAKRIHDDRNGRSYSGRRSSRGRSYSRSRSRSPHRRSRSRDYDRRTSRSQNSQRSKSRSKSPIKNGKRYDDSPRGRDSRSPSGDRKRSSSPLNGQRSPSASPKRNGNDSPSARD
ncbi:hypothetical protein M3Y94_01094700 [Aphelenchoides besseyi]|nr:hypothetical protein M3Y94_01094700 [Aphelenchoides besseyi]KAI6221672.1 hypothetical protein M3Y95_00987000 [Aphelenchoides besseyi]